MKRASLYWLRADKEIGQSSVCVARTFLLRLRGLLGSKPLAPGEGLLIEPCNAIHTVFMGYSIDVVFVNSAHRVLALAPYVAPWRARTCLGARYVVELASGEINRLQLQVGDVCQLH